MKQDSLFIDLDGIQTDDVEILAQEGSRGMPAFAASSGIVCCVEGACSCTIKEQPAETTELDQN